MSLIWLWATAACLLVVASGEHGGASLRGALEALQRRQRGRMHGPYAPPPDYDALYEFMPPVEPYSNPDYVLDFEEKDDEPKYIVKYLEANVHPPEAYPVYNKKNYQSDSQSPSMKDSAFRERSHHVDNDRLKELFIDRKDVEENNDDQKDRDSDDAEYAQLLKQLWSKYKYSNHINQKKPDFAPQGVIKLYKEKRVTKRYPDNWGPIAFKRKRSSGSEDEHPIISDLEGGRKPHGDGMPVDPNYNSYDLSEDEKDDIREEYAIAFQPLDDDSPTDLRDEHQYAYDSMEKRSAVTKRSSEYPTLNKQKKRSPRDQSKFRGSSGTDPKIIKDLSKIFGDSNDDSIKNPVKRSSGAEHTKQSYEPPQVAAIDHSQEGHPMDQHHNPPMHEHPHVDNKENIESHEQHGYLHHPGMFGKETEHPEIVSEKEKPKTVKKKSIDWSDYFGIDKRNKKSSHNFQHLKPNPMRKLYFNTFNNEVIYPLNNFGEHRQVKRNYVETKQDEHIDSAETAHGSEAKTEEKRETSKDDDDSKLDNIDKKLKNMEGFIVDEALHYSKVGDDLDSKEEQEMKEKLLSKLAAAYSLEKMRKALKDFKQSLQLQKNDPNVKSSDFSDEMKNKRVAVKKELRNDISQQNKEDDKSDFEDEQGAGQFLNGKIEKQFSEGYMGGSGRHKHPALPTAVSPGSCPALSKIVQRCHEVDLLAGDRGQLFLPLCSLHQICYLCGETAPTTCDLVFLSEADTSCEGDMACQRAARSALMTLRELHDSLADELDGECEASPCLTANLKMNLNWQRAVEH